MDRGDQGGGESGHEEVELVVVVPLPLRPLPPQGEDAVYPLLYPLLVAPDDGQVGNEPHVEEDGAHRHVGAHGEDVPDQGRAEVDPELALVRVGEEVEKLPHPAQVYQGKQPRHEERKYRHRLGGAVEARPEAGAEEVEDRRYEGPRVGDPHPEDEVRDVDPPAHGVTDPRNAHAVLYLVAPADQEDDEQGRAETEGAQVDDPRFLHRGQDVRFHPGCLVRSLTSVHAPCPLFFPFR